MTKNNPLMTEDEALKKAKAERRRYALLQAAAVLLPSETAAGDFQVAVDGAEELLAIIEKRESERESV